MAAILSVTTVYSDNNVSCESSDINQLLRAYYNCDLKSRYQQGKVRFRSYTCTDVQSHTSVLTSHLTRAYRVL